MHSRFWPSSHFSGSCGAPPLAIVNDYIVHQKRPD
jgi:REP element-mobilizing transposase RayT